MQLSIVTRLFVYRRMSFGLGRLQMLLGCA